MKTFEECQATANQVPYSLRNNRDRINLPVVGLQEEAGRNGSLLAAASASRKAGLVPGQSTELKDRLAGFLTYVARLCGETRIALQAVAASSIPQIQVRVKKLDPNRQKNVAIDKKQAPSSY